MILLDHLSEWCSVMMRPCFVHGVPGDGKIVLFWWVLYVIVGHRWMENQSKTLTFLYTLLNFLYIFPSIWYSQKYAVRLLKWISQHYMLWCKVFCTWRSRWRKNSVLMSAIHNKSTDIWKKQTNNLRRPHLLYTLINFLHKFALIWYCQKYAVRLL